MTPDETAAFIGGIMTAGVQRMRELGMPAQVVAGGWEPDELEAWFEIDLAGEVYRVTTHFVGLGQP